MIQNPHFKPQLDYGMTNRGLKIRLPLTCTLDGKDHLVMLGCAEPRGSGEKVEYQIGIYLALLEDNRFVRTRLHELPRIPTPCNDYTIETIYISDDDPAPRPTQKQYNFHVIEPSLPGRWERFQGVVAPTFRGKKSIPRSKAKSVAFTFVGSTSPGQGATSREFGLERGGRVGVLFRPSKRYIGTIGPVIGSEPKVSKTLEFIVLIFGVNLNESVYGDIAGVMKEEYDILRKKRKHESGLPSASHASHRSDEGQIFEWLEEYIRKSDAKYSTKKVEREIWDLMFSVDIQQRSGGFYDVKIVYRPR